METRTTPNRRSVRVFRLGRRKRRVLAVVRVVPQGAARAPTLCVRLRRSLFAHAPGGETRTAPLPRDALGDFAPCALGLLMRTRRGVFALRHPLDEPAPVTSVFGADGADALGRVAAAASPPATPSPAECIAWSSADSLYFLTHDPARESHALWRVAPATAERRNAADAPFAEPFEADASAAAGARATPETDAFDARDVDAEPSTSPPASRWSAFGPSRGASRRFRRLSPASRTTTTRARHRGSASSERTAHSAGTRYGKRRATFTDRPRPVSRSRTRTREPPPFSKPRARAVA